MEEVLLYIFIVLTIIALWLVLHYWYKIQSRQFIQSFIDSQATITILTTDEKITMINKEGLALLGVKSIDELQEKHTNIVNFFLEVPGCTSCLDKYTFGQKWVSNMYNAQDKSSKSVNKVKIYSQVDELEHYFQIKASKLQGSKEYIVNFTDISFLEKEKDSLEKSADYDPLTKIYNRVKIMKVFEDLKYSSKHNELISLVLFDIDKFKSINDTYGHNIGDKVLVELASVVKSMLRKEDFIARWGGEEFIILFSNTPVEKARKITERIRAAVESYPFETVKKVTCSFGITEFSNSDNQVNFLERADQALYEAKESGRNRVIVKLKESPLI